MKLPCKRDRRRRSHYLKESVTLPPTYIRRVCGQAFHLSSVVHHEVGAPHSIGALGRRDPKLITAGVPHGEESERVPPLVC